MKKDHMLFPIIFLIYIAAGIVSIILFYTNGSELSRRLDAKPVVSESTKQPDSSSAVGEVSPVTTPAYEAADEPQQAPAAKPDTSGETQNDTVLDDQPADKPSDDPADTTSEDTTDEISDVVPEEMSNDSNDSSDEASDQASDDTDTETETDADDNRTYYAFAVNKGVTHVRVRMTADRSSEIVGNISDGDTGYILEAGDIRSKIVTKDGSVMGYIYNEYITITEIPKKDFPKEYR